MKKLLLLLLAAAILSCSSIKVAYDYDRQADFTRYKTYALSEDDLTASVGQLNRDRIIKVLEAEMINEGFTKSDNPDLLVDVHIKSQEKVQATATTTGGYGYGRWGGYGGYSTTQINYDEYTEGTLFITFIDKAEQQLVWQGTGTKTLSDGGSPEKREQNITYSIQQILSNYPPGQ